MPSWGGGIVIYRSYALYEEEKTYNVLKGTIPDFNYDVKVAVTIDGSDSKTIPETPYTSEDQNKYYQAQVECDNDAEGEWDYNSWNLKVDYLTTTNTKCKVEFTSNIKKEDYDAYIQKGVATRRNTYRGKDITSLYTTGELYKQIEDGTFKDIYVGDYFTTKDPTDGSKTITWLVADLDNYLYTGNTKLIKHHATIIPAAPLTKAAMNDTATTTGGYYGSKMVSGCNGQKEGKDITGCDGSILDSVLETYITPVFNSHVITYYNLLTNAINDAKTNRYGNVIEEDKSKGASNGWGWSPRQLDLMSEMNVYGSIVWSSSGYDTGIDNRQYAIFRLKPEFINSDGNQNRFWYWLKDVTSSSSFAHVGKEGNSGGSFGNNEEYGVRPRFLIGG